MAHSGMYFFNIDRSPDRLRSAEESVLRALTIAPDLPEAHLAMGYYYYNGFLDYEKALDEFSIAEQGMPGASELFEARGILYRRSGNWEAALANMDRAIELDPRNVERLRQQAMTYLLLREHSQAETYLDRALAIAPDDSETYFWKIQVPLFRDGDTAELSAAAADLPFEIAGRRPYGWIAAVYERDFQRALLELDDASIDLFEWQVQYVPKASYYGITYHLADQPALAREFFQDARYQLEAALQENPRDPRILLSLAEAITRQVEAMSHAEGPVGVVVSDSVRLSCINHAKVNGPLIWHWRRLTCCQPPPMRCQGPGFIWTRS